MWCVVVCWTLLLYILHVLPFNSLPVLLLLFLLFFLFFLLFLLLYLLLLSLTLQAMFQTIGEMSPEAGHKELRTFTVCVGRRETPADFYTSDVKV